MPHKMSFIAGFKFTIVFEIQPVCGIHHGEAHRADAGQLVADLLGKHSGGSRFTNLRLSTLHYG